MTQLKAERSKTEQGCKKPQIYLLLACWPWATLASSSSRCSADRVVWTLTYISSERPQAILFFRPECCGRDAKQDNIISLISVDYSYSSILLLYSSMWCSLASISSGHTSLIRLVQFSPVGGDLLHLLPQQIELLLHIQHVILIRNHVIHTLIINPIWWVLMSENYLCASLGDTDEIKNQEKIRLDKKTSRMWLGRFGASGESF